MVSVGDRVRARINYGMEGGGLLPPEEGVVVYVHPEGRFYTVEFTFPKGRFRESYWLAPPPERMMSQEDVIRARLQAGRHNKINGALGKYLETM